MSILRRKLKLSISPGVAVLLLLNTIVSVLLSGAYWGVWRDDDEWVTPGRPSVEDLEIEKPLELPPPPTPILPPPPPPPPPAPAPVKEDHKGPNFCEQCGRGDKYCLQYGAHNLARSRVYEGPNARLQRVIRNAQAGNPTKIGVIGGSVTCGQSVIQDENWPVRFGKFWEKTFPRSKTTVQNGAVAATGSQYYYMCFLEHIDEDVDLVIVELGINDQRFDIFAHSYEWLLRGLLNLPKSPAVINLQTLGLAFDAITTGNDLHTSVAVYYDTPVISIRNVLLPIILKNSDIESHYYRSPEGHIDLRHVNKHGHAMMADFLGSFIQRQICAMTDAQTYPPYKSDGLLPEADMLEDIPRMRMFQKYDHDTVVAPVRPMCMSTRTERHPLKPLHAEGWEPWVWERPGQKKAYLVAKQPGSPIAFEVNVHSMGRVRVTYLHSKTFGLGSLLCWLDDDTAQAVRLDGWWEFDNINVAATEVIREDATPGKHILNCHILEETKDPGGGHEFRLIAVDAA